ncbi:MAG TPA: tetraacyldisaccharide 4'-kinase [Myxococcaceae bacterium]|nr:tetraacyldisaccharide 4'-kinase [Myxococcaceae bacterium]
MSTWLEQLWYPEEEDGPSGNVTLAPLALGAAAFGVGARTRNALYDLRVFKPTRIEGAKVISVGNLNVGGAGKTPVVIHLAQLLRARGKKVAVLTRGYGRRSKERRVLDATAGELPSAADAGDEPLLIARSCPGVPVLVGSDRVASAQQARDHFGVEYILLDDGMQHRRLARDVELVVVDERVGLGNGQLLPRGPLREPISSLKRATLLWVRSAESGMAKPLPKVDAPMVRARYRVKELSSPTGEVRDAYALRGRRVLALAGLARPASFLRTLQGLGVTVPVNRFFADHHAYSAAELEEVKAAASQSDLLIITTEKDWMRLPPGFPTWVVRLEVELVSGEDALLRALGLEATPEASLTAG